MGLLLAVEPHGKRKTCSGNKKSTPSNDVPMKIFFGAPFNGARFAKGQVALSFSGSQPEALRKSCTVSKESMNIPSAIPPLPDNSFLSLPAYYFAHNGGPVDKIANIPTSMIEWNLR